MSVVVRMEMPKSCDVCPCLDDYGDYPRCRISEEQRGYNFPILEKRMPNCPIICQLPERHGALIDLETAAEGLSERYNSCHMTCGVVMQFLDGLPTIVPAEAERSETWAN